MLSVKVEDYGETEDQMHYVTYRASGLSEKELDFLLNNLEGETIVEDGDLLLNIFYIKREEIEMTYFIASFLEDMK